MTEVKIHVVVLIQAIDGIVVCIKEVTYGCCIAMLPADLNAD